jgi:glycosyltransferase involved in cell wall biosynthesis
MKLSVIIPVYNESRTIREIIQRVQAVGLADEIVVVDDGSADGTRQVLSELCSVEQPPRSSLRVILHEKNQGKGAAVYTGIQNASGDVILVQDADLEYDPRDIPALLKPLQEGMADVVYGSRFLGGPRRPTMFWHMVANQLLTLMTNILYDTILNVIEIPLCGLI